MYSLVIYELFIRVIEGGKGGDAATLSKEHDCQFL